VGPDGALYVSGVLAPRSGWSYPFVAAKLPTAQGTLRSASDFPRQQGYDAPAKGSQQEHPLDALISLEGICDASSEIDNTNSFGRQDRGDY